ncbi:Protein of unknown function [Pyronema omphalodes CBS 100304]|uniref:Uncharacterized protein n=1 Tax=Pyronema omphalodes (strain CBS 100304) TaxID=1076935 RepID=U4LQT5_PYROM|nr:Protein of unknown function [Pyronema omphalodes CBS 100304]
MEIYRFQGLEVRSGVKHENWR